MSLVFEILKYAGLSITGAMALFSLFFEATESVPGSARKRLTEPGKVALAVVVLSIVVSLSSGIASDVLDSQKARGQSEKQEELEREVKLGNQVFDSIELSFVFDGPINWQDPNFFSSRLAESLTGVYSTTTLAFADWQLTKLSGRVAPREERSILYLETRREVIKSFAEQNQPGLLNGLPRALEFYGDEKSLHGYHPPAILLFDQSVGQQFSDSAFNIKDNRLTFRTVLDKRYPEILGSTIDLAYRFAAPDSVLTGSKWYERRPSEVPFFATHIRSVELFLNHQLLGEIYRTNEAGLQVTPGSSEYDIEYNNYYTKLAQYRITRELLLKKYNPDMAEVSPLSFGK